MPLAIVALGVVLGAAALCLALAAAVTARRGLAVGSGVATLVALAVPTMLSANAVVGLGAEPAPAAPVMRAAWVSGVMATAAWASTNAGAVMILVVPAALIAAAIASARATRRADSALAAASLGVASLVFGVALLMRVQRFTHAFLAMAFAAPHQRAEIVRGGIDHGAIDPAASVAALGGLWLVACVVAVVVAVRAARNGQVAPPSAVAVSGAVALVGLTALAAASWGSAALATMVSAW